MPYHSIPFPTLVRVDPELFALWTAAARESGDEVGLALLERNEEGIEIQRRSEARAILQRIRDLMGRGEFLVWRPTLARIASELANLMPADNGGTSATRSYASLGHRPAVIPPSGGTMPPGSGAPAHQARMESSPRMESSSRISRDDYFAALGRRLGLRAVPRRDFGAANVSPEFADFDLLWIDDDGVVSAFLLGIGRGVLDCLLTLADAAAVSHGRHRFYVVGDAADRAPLAEALRRPSFQTLRVRDAFGFLTTESVHQRLRPIDDLIEFLSPEFLSRLSLTP